MNDFPHDSERILASGPGRIVGTATVDGKPLAGLRLRLALNGAVMSQWATTGTDGTYDIGVPYGKYRVDGYNLDRETANVVLPGKILTPRSFFPTSTFEVAAGAPGQGLNLAFVDPVILDIGQSRFSSDDDIVIRWQPYEGAEDYEIQIFENANERGFGDRKPVFSWSDRPVVDEPQVNLADYGVELTPGRFYTVYVEARGNEQQPLSENVRTRPGFDFRVVE